jgi:hypothetical protein
MKVLGIGTIIEFKDCKLNGKPLDETHVDRISTINLHLDGHAEYWTELYPELCGVEPNIHQDRIVAHYNYKPFIKPDNLPIIPANIGELISFTWDDNKRLYGIVKEAYNIIDSSGTYDWRMTVGTENYYLCGDETEYYKIRIEKVADDRYS